MFEAAELGKTLSKREYDKLQPRLQETLLEAHLEIKKAGLPVIIIISGVSGSGKAELLHRLNEWLDPRGVDTHAMWQESDEEEERPLYWRYWRRMPAKGRVGIFLGSWYTKPIVDRVYGRNKKRDPRDAMDRVRAMEEMLSNDGALIIKLWFHRSRASQKTNLKSLSRNPKKKWRVRPADWENFRRFDDFMRISEDALRHTDSGSAPWHVVDAFDRRYRELTSGQIILQSIQDRLKALPKREPVNLPPAFTVKVKGRGPDTILDAVDLRQRLNEREYEKLLKEHQAELSRLVWQSNKRGRSSVIVFEGWDAAGKGSAIRRVTGAMDPRLYQVIPVAAPTDEERAHHYLWRFWRNIPRDGKLVIFDRSWYGRVLVERVENFATPEEWQRAFLEINDFEEQLTEHQTMVTKFWLHISKDEQLRRFKERKATAAKRYKITEEDWRNRGRWDAYKLAVNEMVEHTSTGPAPWTLVAGNDKKFARIQILRTLCENLRRGL